MNFNIDNMQTTITIITALVAIISVLTQLYNSKSTRRVDETKVAELVEKVYGSIIGTLQNQIKSLENEIHNLKKDKDESNKILEIIYKFNCGAHCRILAAVKKFRDEKKIS